MVEIREHQLKRLRMRSMRRGIKEMDLILDEYAKRRIDGLSDDWLLTYDDLLSENDHDLYSWVTGQVAPPPRYSVMIADIALHGVPAANS